MGQDASYLFESPRYKEYKVLGTIRMASIFNRSMIDCGYVNQQVSFFLITTIFQITSIHQMFM